VSSVRQRLGVDRRSLEQRAVLVYGLIGLTLGGLTFYLNVRSGAFGFDFRGSLWKAGRDILAGRSPYPPPDPAHLAHAGNAFVYPPLSALVALPLAALPHTAAAAIWSLANCLALMGALWVVGLRQGRCYLLCLASYPVVDSLIVGQLSGLIALSVAVAWRFRERAVVAGFAAAVAIVLKLLAWPLLVWLLVTRRFKAAAVCAASTALLLLASWAAIGFDGLTGYPRLLGADAAAFQNHSDSVVALLLRAGFSPAVSRLLAILAAVAILELARRRARTDEPFALALALAAGIVASPIVHAHYWVVLFVPFAVSRRSASWLWLIPLGFWASPVEPPRHTWQIAVGLALAASAVLSVRTRRSGSGARRGSRAQQPETSALSLGEPAVVRELST
jgi:hypothetical protein